MDFNEAILIKEYLEKGIGVLIKTKIPQKGENCWTISPRTKLLYKCTEKLYLENKAIGKALDVRIINEEDRIFEIDIKWLPEYGLVYTNNPLNDDLFILGKEYSSKLKIVETIHPPNPNALKLPL